MQRSFSALAGASRQVTGLATAQLKSPLASGRHWNRRQRSTAVLPLPPMALELFHFLDWDKNGTISRSDYDTAVDNLGAEEIRAFSKLAFHAIDEDGNGHVSREEFERALGSMSVEDVDFFSEGFSRRSEVLKTAEDDGQTNRSSFVGTLKHRFEATAEVCLSKIFPAGFGWQASSVLAGGMGLEATDVAFFLCTGVGDALGVGLGHVAWNMGKAAMGYDVNLRNEKQTAVLLMTGCMFSGTAWQPLVNVFHDAGFSFNSAAAGTMAGCSAGFFFGLRLGRQLWSRSMPAVAAPSYKNLKADAQLSVAVGGATGAFVGTDTGFVNATTGVDSNWLRPIVGVEDNVSDVAGCVLAGTSTSIGFVATQAGQNVTVAPGKSWVDN